MKLLKVVLFFIAPISLFGQLKKITNKEIWSYEFSAEKLQEIHPLNSASQYTVLEVNRKTRVSKVVAYDYATAEFAEEIINSSVKIETISLSIQLLFLKLSFLKKPSCLNPAFS